MSSPLTPPAGDSPAAAPAGAVVQPRPPALKWAIAGLAAGLVYLYWTAIIRTPVHLQLGLLMVFLSAFPSLRWIARGGRSLPVFEVLLLTTLNTYALPLLNGHEALADYTDDVITQAATVVVLFQLLAIGVYEFTRAHQSLRPFWREEVIRGDITPWIGRAMVINTIYVLLSSFTDVIPSAFGSLLRAACFGIGTIAAFITARRLGLRELSSGEAAFFGVNVVIQCIAMMTTLYLVSAVSLLLLSLVGYVSSRHRVPVIACAVVLPLIAILHNGKDEMREKYWQPEVPKPTVAQLPDFFTEWFQFGLFSEDSENKRVKITHKLIDRTSLFHILCLVVNATPESAPYLDGKTYEHIPAQFVPRPLWPDKPTGQASATQLSTYYGLQTEEDAQHTSIGFGLIAEGYANFGYIGVGAIAVAFAFLIKKVQCWAVGAPLFSYGGLLLVILLAWSFQVEFTLSTWITSFYHACVAVLGIAFVQRRLFP